MNEPPKHLRGTEGSASSDLVFAGEPGGKGRRLAMGTAIVFALYAGVFAAASRLGRSAGPWRAEPAAHVHFFR